MQRATLMVAALTLMFGSVGQAKAGAFYLYSGGDNVVVNTGPPSDPNVLQVTSNTAAGQPGYGGMYYDATTDGLTFGGLNTLSALYEMTQGTINAGAPRFTLFDFNGNSAYVYWGTPTGGGSFSDPTAGTFASTGNYINAGSPDVRFYPNGFGGVGNGNTGYDYSDFLALEAATPIQYITIDLDGGFAGTQQMITDEFTVNGNVYEAGPDPTATPEPASLTLLGIAIAGMAGYGWRKRKQVAAC